MTRLRETGHGEAGYTLVALLALMALLAMFALAAAPSIRQQTQREREKEAIFRGEQVADAIRAYYLNGQFRGVQSTNALPTSMDQLLEGVQLPGRTTKLQILRPSAAHDPLSADGEWRRVSPTSPDLRGFVASLTEYSGGVPPVPKGNFGSAFASLIPQVTSILDTDTRDDSSSTSSDTSGPFIGVASKSDRSSVITYYGIDRHDQWIFTPLFR